MKTVLLEMEAGKPKWHPLFADLMASLGIVPRVCKARTPQTKGRSNGAWASSKPASGLA